MESLLCIVMFKDHCFTPADISLMATPRAKTLKDTCVIRQAMLGKAIGEKKMDNKRGPRTEPGGTLTESHSVAS